jgi:hypothetical protein
MQHAKLRPIAFKFSGGRIPFRKAGTRILAARVIADLDWSLRLRIRSALCSSADWFQELFVEIDLPVLCDEVVRCLERNEFEGGAQNWT